MPPGVYTSVDLMLYQSICIGPYVCLSSKKSKKLIQNL